MKKEKAYLGIDIGSISTKGVIIDKDNRIIAKEYIWTKGDPIKAVKNNRKCKKINRYNNRSKCN